jgi:hypothetical protein
MQLVELRAYCERRNWVIAGEALLGRDDIEEYTFVIVLQVG